MRFSRPLLAFSAVMAVVSLLSGCAAPTSTRGPAEPVIQTSWPEPPDTPRYVFEGMLRSPADIRKENEDQRLRRILTGQGSIPSEPVYKKPAAVAAAHGRIYVADPPTASVIVFDVPRQRVFQMGIREPNQVKKPVALALDADGRVYVLDAHTRRVMVFDPLGLFLFAVGDPKALTQPVGVAVSRDGQRIFVVDRGSLGGDDHKVVAYAPDGRELFQLGPRGSEDGQFNIPLAATVTPDDTLLVLDSGNFRVQVFDLDGRHRLSFGSVGNGLGQFSRPRSIAADQDGNIFVSDASFNNVQIFNAAGQLLMWIGKTELRMGPGQFGLIAGIAVDETGRLYASDQFHNKIEIYRRALPTDLQAPVR